ncbi:trigger factor [bacterium]|nr:trigger factor [bacterium]
MEEPRADQEPENEPTAPTAAAEQPTPAAEPETEAAAPEAVAESAADPVVETEEAEEATDAAAAVVAETEEAEEPVDEGPKVSVEIEETGSCSRKLKFDVPTELVKEEIDKSYDELRNTVVLKGFRKGRVPRHVLESRFGEDVLKGVKQAIIDEHFQDAVKTHDVNLALAPEIDFDTITLTAGETFVFELDVEIVPEFTLDNYKGIEVARPSVGVTDEDVDKAVDGLRLQRGAFGVVEEGEVEDTDVPVVHAAALADGEEVWRGEELGANIAGGTVAGITVPSLKDALLGAKAGDSKTFQVTLPDDFQVEDQRGKDVELEVTIDAIRRFTRPEVTDAWAEELGFDDVEDLREEVASDLRRQRDQEADTGVQDAIADRLLQLTDFEVPEGLVDRMVEGARERRRMSLLYQGTPEEQIDAMTEGGDDEAREGVIRQVKLHFMHEKIAEQEKIFVTEEEVAQRIQAIALNYRRRAEEVEAEMEDSGRLSSLRQQMREEKVRDYLVQEANISGGDAPETEAPAETGAPTESGDDA